VDFTYGESPLSSPSLLGAYPVENLYKNGG